jgi:hypothetical protein
MGESGWNRQSMRICDHCGHQIEGELLSCPGCGSIYDPTIKDSARQRNEQLVNRIAEELLNIRTKESLPRKFIAFEIRWLPIQFVPALLATLACTLSDLNWSLVGGLLLGLSLFQVSLFKLFSKHWSNLEQWIDWDKVNKRGSMRK